MTCAMCLLPLIDGSPMPRVILGIDPGYADMGFGAVSAEAGRDRCVRFGSIGTPKGTEGAVRLRAVYQGLQDLIEAVRPTEAAVEKLFFSTNVKTALSVAEARGVILLCLADHAIPVREFSPQEVKIGVCGHGGAEKMQVQEMVMRLLRLREIPKPDDAADALALALTAAHTTPLLMR